MGFGTGFEMGHFGIVDDVMYAQNQNWRKGLGSRGSHTTSYAMLTEDCF